MIHTILVTVLAVNILGGPLSSSRLQEWELEVRLQGVLTPHLVEQYREHVREKPPIVLPAEPRPRVFRGMGTNVTQWRELVAKHFLPEDVEMALRVMACESGGNPNAKNPTSTASGLFQHMRGWWSGAWGYPAFNPFDPESSVRAAAFLRYRNGWTDWRASQHCWG